MRPPVMNRRRMLAVALSAAVFANVAACSSDPVPRDYFYRLGEPAAPPTRAGGAMKGILEVPPPRAAGIINERAILYRDVPRQLAQYSYHAWIEPPAQMIQRSLIDALRKAQAFETVVSPEMRSNRDYELVSDLRKWEHVRSDNTVAIEIEIALRGVRGNHQLLLKTYNVNEPVAGDSIAAVADAFTRGLDEVYKDLVADLGALPKP